MAKLQKKKRRVYTDQEKREAILNYMLLGSYRAVADEMGIHHTTILDWAKKPWWQDTKRAIEHERRECPVSQDLNRRLDRIISKMVERLEDPAIIAKFQPRELGYNIRELRRALMLDKGPSDFMEVGTQSDPGEIDKLLRDVIAELRESKKFGESGRELSDLPAIQEMMELIEMEDEENGARAAH